MVANAVHPLGGAGLQYVTWTAAAQQDLGRCERMLRERSAYRDTHRMAGMTAVEGHDPDGMVVTVTYPGPDAPPVQELPARVCGW